MNPLPPRNERRRMAYRPPLERTREEGGLGLYRRFFRQYVWPSRRRLITCMLLVSLNACSWYIMAYYMRYVVDHVLVVEAGRQTPADAPAKPPARPPHAGWRLAGLFALYTGTIVLLNVSARLSQRGRLRIGQDMVAALRADVHRKVLRLSRSYHEAHKPGQIMSRILADVNVVQNHMLATLLDAGTQGITFAVGFAILLTADWRAALIVAAVIPPFAYLYRRNLKQLKRINKELRHTNACLYGLLSQKLDAVRAIFGYARERHEELNVHQLSACFTRDAIAQQRLNSAMGRTSQVIISVTAMTVLLLGTLLVIRGRMSLGQLLYLYGTTHYVFGPVQAIAHLSVTITNLMVALQRIVQVLDEREEVAEAAHPVPFPARLKNGIRIQNVRFSYRPDLPPVLKGLSLAVPTGKWVCVMGPSGCGKTTLLHLLARLYDPGSGAILYDDVALPSISLATLRSRLALVPQEPQILSASIRENIAYGRPDADMHRVVAAATAAEIHDAVEAMPLQYETVVGEKGLTLSGGQRQRISLARALLTEPDVLLLDDTTSALDAETEQRVQETLARLLVGRTAVIVSQRVPMAMRCHKISVIANGVVSESGTHAELLTHGGFYATLCHQQLDTEAGAERSSHTGAS